MWDQITIKLKYERLHRNQLNLFFCIADHSSKAPLWPCNKKNTPNWMIGANQSLQDSILVDNFCNFLLIAQYCPFMMGLSGNSQDYHTMCPRCENSCCNKEHTVRITKQLFLKASEPGLLSTLLGTQKEWKSWIQCQLLVLQMICFGFANCSFLIWEKTILNWSSLLPIF